MSIVIVQVGCQALNEFRRRSEIATFQKTTRQRAEPQFDLIEPGAMFGGEVKNVFVFGISQESAALAAGAQIALVKRQSAQAGDEFANVQTPMRVQVVHDPMEALVLGELPGDVVQMGGKVLAGARHAQIPNDLAGRDNEGSDQAAGAVTDVFVFAFLRFAGCDENGGMLALQDLHAGLFVAANDQFPLLVQERGVDIQFANLSRLGVEIRIVAVEPVDAAVRFQIGGGENAPDGRARHGFLGMAINQFGGEIIDAPLTGRAIVLAGFAGGQGDDFELFLGGKSSAADRTAEHLEGQPDRAGESGRAKELRCCGCNRTRWQPADWKADPRLPSGESVHYETPKLAGWSGPASEPASAFRFRGLRQ